MTAEGQGSRLAKLIESIAKRQYQNLRLGKVTEIHANGFRVQFLGDASAPTQYYRRIPSRQLSVDDYVVMARVGNSWVILGKAVKDNTGGGGMSQHANEYHDPDMVSTTGAQSVGGVKTFTDIPVLPAADPTDDNEAARKSYVDDTAAAEVDAHESAGDPHPGYQKESEKGSANGYAGLDGSGNVEQDPKSHGSARHTGVIGYVYKYAVCALVPTGTGGVYQLNDESGGVPIVGVPKDSSVDLVYIRSLNNLTGTVTVYCYNQAGTQQWNQAVALSGVKYNSATPSQDINQFDYLYAKLTAFTSGGSKVYAVVRYKEQVTAT